MKVYLPRNGGRAWGLEVWRLFLAIGASEYPEYMTPWEMLINSLSFTRWPGGGLVRFTPPVHNGFYMQAGVNHPSTAAATAASEGVGR